MNIKFYIKLLTSIFTLTSYCCATLVDTITRNHGDRQKVYNGILFTDHKPINTYTNKNNEILGDERKVDTNRSASPDEKRSIAISVFGAAWTDLTLNAEGHVSPSDMIAERTHKTPYTVDRDGRVIVSNPALQKHFQILYWLDNLARDVVGQVITCPNTVIDESLLDRFIAYKDLYTFDGFEKATVAGWLKSVRTTHEPGLIDLRLQTLENQRDLTDWRDYPKFKELTTEICAYVGQPFVGDAIEIDVLPQGEVLHRWIDSIIRTRHKFCGQPCLGRYGMMNRYTVGYPEHLMYNHEHHIATIMMIDAMAKLAIVDDEFYDMWAGVIEDAPISEDFIKRVLSTMEQDAYGATKPSMWRVKGVARTILQKNPALVRLAGDIFSLYAPKMDLKKVYGELMVSGGTYRGWEIVGLDSFAHVINLTEEQKLAHPNLETYLRKKLLSDPVSLGWIGDLVSTSPNAHTSTNLTINKRQLIEIKYVYKFQLTCLLEQTKGVISEVSINSDAISFYLRRKSKLELLHLNSENNKSMPEDELLFSYYNLAHQFHHGESLTHKIETLPKSILQLRKSFEAGYEDARKSLGLALSNYAVTLVERSANKKNELPEAINLLRESVELGYEPAKKNLGIYLFLYATFLLDKIGGSIKSRLQNIPIINAIYRESYYECDIQEAKEQLAVGLICHAVDINDSSTQHPTLTKEERELILKLLKEAYYVLEEEKAKEPLARFFLIDACATAKGITLAEAHTLNGLAKTEKIRNMLEESVRLGCAEAQIIIDMGKQNGAWSL